MYSGKEILGRLKMNRPGLIPAAIWNMLIDFCGTLILLPNPSQYRIKRVGLIGYTLEIIQGTGGGTPTPLALQPGADVSTTDAAKFTITYGTYGGVVPTIDGAVLVVKTASNVITLGEDADVVYVECDFTFDTGGAKTITTAAIKSAASDDYADLVSETSGGSSAGGSGTEYQILFGVDITAPEDSGPYRVTAAPAVGGSQEFAICLNPTDTSKSTISGPWGV